MSLPFDLRNIEIPNADDLMALFEYLETAVNASAFEWRNGTTNPDDATGEDGDFWFNGVSGALFQRGAGEYSQIATLRGATIRSGAGAPANTLGIDDDLFINATNGDVYRRANGAYTVAFNIKGPQGAAPNLQSVSGEITVQDLAIGATTDIVIAHGTQRTFSTNPRETILACPNGIEITPMNALTTGAKTNGAQFILRVKNLSYSTALAGVGGAGPDFVIGWERKGY